MAKAVRLTHSALTGFCKHAKRCGKPCRYKKPIKVATRDAKVVCSYNTYALKDLVIVEQLELFPDTNN